MSNFKVGDKVKFEIDGVTDTGTIVRPWDNDTDTFCSKEPRWWVLWDSDEDTEHVTEDCITLVTPSIAVSSIAAKDLPAKSTYEDLIKAAAYVAISNGEYNLAISTLNLLLNE